MPAAKKSKMLYVGGLDHSVTEEIVYAAFIPFGDIREVNLPKDFTENKNKGFAFVDYEEEEDASAAVENMHGSELQGKVLKVNMARATVKLQPGKAVWSSEEWLNKANNQGDENADDGVSS
jgi:peptidyl-prolyl isomerase E (cyclophilin E)